VAKVADAAAPLNIFIGRDGGVKERQSAPLAVLTGSLCPGEILTASVSDLVRGDGASLGLGQVTAWGQADSTAPMSPCISPLHRGTGRSAGPAATQGKYPWPIPGPPGAMWQ